MRALRVVVIVGLALSLGAGALATAGRKATARRASRLAKPLIVVDANGKFVGSLLDLPGNGGAQVVRRLGGVSVIMSARAEGFENFNGPPAFLFESTNCSGPLLLGARDSGSRFFPPTAFIVGSTAYYVEDGTPRSIRSRAYIGSDQADCDHFGAVFVAPNLCCFGAPGPTTALAREPVAFDLTTLGLVTPFHLDIPTASPPTP
jgi:hypothetical protein